MSIKVSAVAALMVAGATMHAAASEGYDGDGNRLPGLSYSRSVLDNVFAARVHHGRRVVHHAAPVMRTSGELVGETKADQPNAVFWRGRLVGTDPDSQIRLKMLRDAIGG